MIKNDQDDLLSVALQLLLEARRMSEHDFDYQALLSTAGKLLPSTDDRDVAVLMHSLMLLHARLDLADLPREWRGSWLDAEIDTKEVLEQQITYALYAVHRDRGKAKPLQRAHLRAVEQQ